MSQLAPACIPTIGGKGLSEFTLTIKEDGLWMLTSRAAGPLDVSEGAPVDVTVYGMTDLDGRSPAVMRGEVISYGESQSSRWTVSIGPRGFKRLTEKSTPAFFNTPSPQKLTGQMFGTGSVSYVSGIPSFPQDNLTVSSLQSRWNAMRWHLDQPMKFRHICSEDLQVGTPSLGELPSGKFSFLDYNSVTGTMTVAVYDQLSIEPGYKLYGARVSGDVTIMSSADGGLIGVIHTSDTPDIRAR